MSTLYFYVMWHRNISLTTKNYYDQKFQIDSHTYSIEDCVNNFNKSKVNLFTYVLQFYLLFHLIFLADNLNETDR